MGPQGLIPTRGAGQRWHGTLGLNPGGQRWCRALEYDPAGQDQVETTWGSGAQSQWVEAVSWYVGSGSPADWVCATHLP